ncbi:MAG: DUF4340 domain-containing protein [Planctomycetes bacterium]|nr:DUF4340 domain-containing protein [Planctomycetota bacterium]
MRLGTLLVLLALVGGLVAVLLLTSEKPKVEESAEILALDGRSLREAKVVRWQFKNPDQQPFELSRGDDGVFSLSEPIVDRASFGYVQQIVAAWDSANLIATDYSDDEKGHKETGLGAPSMTFAVDWADGHRIEYDLGGPGPMGSDRFLRRDGKIWRGGNGLYESMRVNLSDLRDRQVFLHREIVCRELTVESATATGKRETIHLVKKDGAWRLLEPFEGRAAQGAAVQFVTAVLSLRADEFMASVVRLPEGEPAVVVRAVGSGGTEELKLWVDQGAAFGQLPGRTSWFQCDPRTYGAVFQNAAERLRARTLLGFEELATELAQVVIDPGQGRGDRLHLARDSVGNDWRIVEPVGYTTDPTPMNELVQSLNNLRAVEFVDGASVDDPVTGLGPGRLALSCRGFEQREATTLWLGAEVDRGDQQLVYCVRADEPGTVALVPAGAVQRLRRDWTTYCEREIVRVAVHIGMLRIRRPGRAAQEPVREYRHDQDAGHWVESGRTENRDDVREFADNELRDLHGTRAVDLRAGKGFGEPDWVLELCRQNGDVIQTLRAWDRSEQPVVLQNQRNEEVGFEVGIRASRELRALWQPR